MKNYILKIENLEKIINGIYQPKFIFIEFLANGIKDAKNIAPELINCKQKIVDMFICCNTEN